MTGDDIAILTWPPDFHFSSHSAAEKLSHQFLGCFFFFFFYKANPVYFLQMVKLTIESIIFKVAFACIVSKFVKGFHFR